MNRREIQAIQERIGATTDGWWGPRSIAAAQAHLRRLMPTPNPWPTEAGLSKFFGDPGDESNLVNFHFPDGWLLYGATPIKKHRCHRLVAESLERILPKLKIRAYDGCFNFRNKRGGTTYSVHSWGAAIDLEASRNGNRTHWPTVANMPFEVMEEFSREGWLSAGAFWSRDAMHFEAVTRS